MHTLNTISMILKANGDVEIVSERPLRMTTFIHLADGSPSVDSHALTRAIMDFLDTYREPEGEPGPGQGAIPGLTAADVLTNAGGIVTRVSHGWDGNEWNGAV